MVIRSCVSMLMIPKRAKEEVIRSLVNEQNNGGERCGHGGVGKVTKGLAEMLEFLCLFCLSFAPVWSEFKWKYVLTVFKIWITQIFNFMSLWIYRLRKFDHQNSCPISPPSTSIKFSLFFRFHGTMVKLTIPSGRTLKSYRIVKITFMACAKAEKCLMDHVLVAPLIWHTIIIAPRRALPLASRHFRHESKVV